MPIYSISPLPPLRPWSTQPSAFAGMSSDSDSNSNGEAPAPVKVEAAPSKVREFALWPALCFLVLVISHHT